MSKKKPSTPKDEHARRHAAKTAIQTSLNEIDELFYEIKRVRALINGLVPWAWSDGDRELPLHVVRWNELADAAWRGSHRDEHAANELRQDFAARVSGDVAATLDFALSRAFEAAVGYDPSQLGAEIIDLDSFRRSRARRRA
jgi:hypothetical protein